MQLEPQVTFKNVDPSDFVLGQIQAHLTKLDQKFPGITSCRVVFERPHHRHHKSDRFRLDLVIVLPGGLEIVVNRAAPDVSREDPKVAVREAFEIAERRIIHSLGRRQDNARHAHVELEEPEPS
jgi:ribosome-associated translation inhibitor RaiA